MDFFANIHEKKSKIPILQSYCRTLYISTENLFEFPLTFPSHCFSVVASEEPLIWNLINIKENWAFLKSSLSSLTKLNMYIILLMH